MLAQGYEFVLKRCRALETDVFETRLMLRTAVCAMGSEAARMFSQPGRFARRGTLPPTTLMLLQDLDSVQRLEDISLSRMPAIPESRFVLRDVRPLQPPSRGAGRSGQHPAPPLPPGHTKNSSVTTPKTGSSTTAE
jgi:hypothetical protein